MSVSGVFAQMVALLGDATILWRRLQGSVDQQAIGATPTIPTARPQGRIPTLKMPTAKGWDAGQTPVAAPGLKVNAFATGLKHPRWINVLPNGDVTCRRGSVPARGRSSPSSTTPWSAR
jgi:glucose/arabinose dehydrogenase